MKLTNRNFMKRENKMQIVPTLNFGGNCREAIQMYEKAFHGKISCMITYGEANDPEYNSLLKENQKEYIYTIRNLCWKIKESL